MFLVAVTGGIASGKSTVSRMLAELGCPVIDADLIAREGAYFYGSVYSTGTRTQTHAAAIVRERYHYSNYRYLFTNWLPPDFRKLIA